MSLDIEQAHQLAQSAIVRANQAAAETITGEQFMEIIAGDVPDLATTLLQALDEIEALKTAGGWMMLVEAKTKPLKDEIEALKAKAVAFDNARERFVQESNGPGRNDRAFGMRQGFVAAVGYLDAFLNEALDDEATKG